MSEPAQRAPEPIDPAAVWAQFHERLHAYVRARVPREQDAEDLVQDVFERIQASARNGTDVTSISGWVHQITRNALVDYYRARARDQQVESELADGPDDGDKTDVIPERPPDPGAALSRCLRPFAERLPEPYAEALLLVDFGGMSQVEAAKQLGISVSGMKSRVQRGRAKLRERVLDCCDVELDRRQHVVGVEPRERPVRCGCD